MSPHFPTEPLAFRDRPSLYSWGWSWPHNLSVTFSKCWACRCVPAHQAHLSTLTLANVLCFVWRASCVVDCTATEGVCVLLVLLGCLPASPSVLSAARHSDNCCWLEWPRYYAYQQSTKDLLRNRVNYTQTPLTFPPLRWRLCLS